MESQDVLMIIVGISVTNVLLDTMEILGFLGWCMIITLVIKFIVKVGKNAQNVVLGNTRGKDQHLAKLVQLEHIRLVEHHHVPNVQLENIHLLVLQLAQIVLLVNIPHQKDHRVAQNVLLVNINRKQDKQVAQIVQQGRIHLPLEQQVVHNARQEPIKEVREKQVVQHVEREHIQ